MRNFALVLGCLAWVLSCFDAVSYYRAGGQQHRAEARMPLATADKATEESVAGQDGRRMQQRVAAGQAAVEGDQLALERAQRSGSGEAQARQILAADQAALQADRMMQYTVEDFARADPNPAVVAAENRVDVDRRLLVEAMATRTRDRKIAHALAALWAVAAGTALLAWRGRERPAASEDEAEDDADDDALVEGDWEEDPLFTAEDRKV